MHCLLDRAEVSVSVAAERERDDPCKALAAFYDRLNFTKKT